MEFQLDLLENVPIDLFYNNCLFQSMKGDKTLEGEAAEQLESYGDIQGKSFLMPQGVSYVHGCKLPLVCCYI